MHFSVRTLGLAILTLLMISAAASTAQPADAVVRGEVTDTSGGVLPGVAVLATSIDGRILANTVTDEVGRYVFRALPTGRVTLRFQLDGFDVESIELSIQRKVDSQVVTRLKLARVTEQVMVYGKAPVDPPPPPPPPPLVPYIRPVPILIPVAPEEMESICGPAKPSPVPTAIATIQSHLHETGRRIYTKGDELNIDGGTLSGLSVGRNLVARRHFRTNDSGRADRGEHTAGLVQIVSATERSSIAVVIHACNELMEGDFLASFTPEPIRSPHPEGLPLFDDAIRILFADSGQMFGVQGRLMVIDRGGAKGIRVGQRLTLFRRKARIGARPLVLGEAVVVSIRTQSATIRIERAIDAITFDDWAAPQLASPLVAPVARESRLPPR